MRENQIEKGRRREWPPFRTSKYQHPLKRPRSGERPFGPIPMEIRGIERRERHASTVNKKRNGGRVLKVRTPVSSVRPFLRFFRFFRTARRGRREEGLVCRYARGMRHEKPPAGQISERNGRMSYFPYAGLRNREPIRSRFLLAHSCSSFVCNSMDFPFFLR